MKNLYFTYNSLTGHYILAETPNYDRNRVEFKEENGLVKRLKGLVDLKRKSVLNIKEISEKDFDLITKGFKGTKVTPRILS